MPFYLAESQISILSVPKSGSHYSLLLVKKIHKFWRLMVHFMQTWLNIYLYHSVDLKKINVIWVVSVKREKSYQTYLCQKNMEFKSRKVIWLYDQLFVKLFNSQNKFLLGRSALCFPTCSGQSILRDWWRGFLQILRSLRSALLSSHLHLAWALLNFFDPMTFKV